MPKLTQVTVANEVNDVFLGGNIGGKKFLTYTKDVVKAWILSFRPVNAITITGVSGDRLSHPELKGRTVAFIIIDDVTKNIGFARPQDQNNTELIMTDTTVFSSLQTITIVLV